MRWPKGTEPECSAVYVRNEILIPAGAEQVWAWLIRAGRWPEWNSNCDWLRFRDGTGPDLAPGCRFVWKTLGVRLRCNVVVFDPFRELGWSATAFGISAYHGWILENDGRQCHVLSEQTQNGPISAIGRWYLRREIHLRHQNWLESLSRVARNGGPPS